MSKPFNIAFNDIVSSLEKNKDKVAIIGKDGTYHTYSDFKQMITGARAKLKALGVKKGTKVLVFITMSVELYPVLQALFSLGAITIFLDPWMGGSKMNSIIREVKPEILLLNKKAAKYSWLLPSTWNIKTWKIKELPRNNDDWEIENIEKSDTALITFTTGSTGKPKGAKRTYKFIDAQAQALKSKLIGNGKEQNIDYTNLPIVGLAGFAVGNTVVIPAINLMKVENVDSYEINEHLKQTKVNRLVVSPALLDKILVGLDSENSPLKKIVTGGAPISLNLIKTCLDNFPSINFESIYGSTEVEPISSADMTEIANNSKQPLNGVFVGKVDKRLKLVIIKPNAAPINSEYFSQNILNEGEVGEIVVTGNFANKEYYDNDIAFRRYKVVDTQQNIWHRTGDIGYLNKGNLYLVGRENRIINSNHKSFHPFPVEQHIQINFNLKDIGYVQKRTGEVILFISSKSYIDKTAILNEIKKQGYPIDKIIVSPSPLPRDPRHRSKLVVEELI